MAGKVVVFMEIDERLMDSIYPEREKLDFISVTGFQILNHEIQEMIICKLAKLCSIETLKKTVELKKRMEITKKSKR